MYIYIEIEGWRRYPRPTQPAEGDTSFFIGSLLVRINFIIETI